MGLLTQIVVWLNSVANALGRWGLAANAVLPGWLSATLVSIVSGVLFLIVFKYASNQRAIKRVKDDIKANLLALKLFKDSARVALRAQGYILFAALRLMLFSLVPMVVMIVPVFLILGQLALWYQARPLHVDEETVVTLTLNPTKSATAAPVELEPTSAVEATIGPVHIGSKHEVCWNIRSRQSGYHRLVFHAGSQNVEKELAVGDGFMRVSKLRPAWRLLDVLVNPWEKPFDADSPIQSIQIDYPSRSSWINGTDSWVIYWFVVSMAAGFCFRRPFHVNF
ncbi:MAG TPA: hypothetical protein VH592_21295 [Gemmataceae bacterium]|jgi:hypothetical protein